MGGGLAHDRLAHVINVLAANVRSAAVCGLGTREPGGLCAGGSRWGGVALGRRPEDLVPLW